MWVSLCVSQQYNGYTPWVSRYTKRHNKDHKVSTHVNELIVKPSLRGGSNDRVWSHCPAQGLGRLLSTYITHPNICSVITCAETLSYYPSDWGRNFEMQVSAFFFLLCVTRAGGCHYTNAALLSNKGSATREEGQKRKKLLTAPNTDLQITECPTSQPRMSRLFTNVQLLIVTPRKTQEVSCDRRDTVSSFKVRANSLMEVITYRHTLSMVS